MGPGHDVPPPVAAGGPLLTVSVRDLGYAPAQAVVAPGTTVRWRNDGRNRHTVTASDGLFASGTMGYGGTFTITAPATAGTHTYVCDFHAFMRGTLTVSDLTLQQAAPVSAGGRARLSGAAPGAAAGTEVVIERRVTGAWEALARATTGGDGAYTVRTPPLARGAAVRARAGERVSPALRVRVRPRVTVTTDGATASLRVAPAGPGTRVRMEKLDLDTYRWLPVEAGRVGPRGTLSADLPGAGVYRFVVAAGAGLSEATSRAVVHLPYRLRA